MARPPSRPWAHRQIPGSEVDTGVFTAPAQDHRVGAGVAASALQYQLQPTYPAEARRARLEGAVSLCAIIGRDGKIEALQYVSGPAPLRRLRRAAVDSAKQWRYERTLLNGRLVEVETRGYARFTLKDQTRNSSATAGHN
jgi:periplasmic protein TonB